MLARFLVIFLGRYRHWNNMTKEIFRYLVKKAVKFSATVSLLDKLEVGRAFL